MRVKLLLDNKSVTSKLLVEEDEDYEKKLTLRPFGKPLKTSAKGVRVVRDEIFTFPYFVDSGLHAFPGKR